MMNPKLSVIIPCFNSAGTLEEAVSSCYIQGLGKDFEIVIVDDASTDNTKGVMRALAEKHPEVKLFFHEKNKGGGAARNTAVQNAAGDLIFCLDSDDLLGEGTLKKMLDLQISKKADGVGVSDSVKFRGRNIRDISFTNRLSHAGERIPFENLLQKDGALCSLYSTFLFTKEAFSVAGGYPTDHGFDTQGFAWRFLANGLSAYTCPGTTYLHRIDFHKSYYLREYEAGKINHNWFKIYEEFLFLFDEGTRKDILDFNLNDPVHFLNTFIEKRSDIFINDYRAFIVPHGSKKYAEKLNANHSKSPTDLYWLGARMYAEKNYRQAADFFLEAVAEGLPNKHPFYRLLDSLARLNGMTYEEVRPLLEQLFDYQPQGSRLPFYRRVMNKIRRNLSHE